MSDLAVIQALLLTKSERIHFVTLTTVLFISFLYHPLGFILQKLTYPFRAVSSVTLTIKENCGMSLYKMHCGLPMWDVL